MKLYAPLLLVFLSLQNACAVPSKRADLPDASVNFWRSQIRSSLIPGKTCIFYYRTTQDARRFPERPENVGKYVTAWNLFDADRFMEPTSDYLKPWSQAGRSIEYFQHLSQVMAESCKDEAFVMLPDSARDEPKVSVWTDTEFPTIRGNLLGAAASGVNKVTRVDSNGKVIRTLWTKPDSLAITGKTMRILPLGGTPLGLHTCMQLTEYMYRFNHRRLSSKPHDRLPKAPSG